MQDIREKSDFTIRPANSSDYDELHRLISTCWLELYAPHLSETSTARFLEGDPVGCHLRTSLDFAHVAVVDEVLVGVVVSSFGWISSLFVAHAHRRTGIGTLLLETAELEGGCGLDVAEFNENAIRFYQRRGWKRTDRFQEAIAGTGLTLLLMGKPPRGDISVPPTMLAG